MNPLKMLCVGLPAFFALIVCIVLDGLHGVYGCICIVAAMVLGLSIGSIVEWVHEEKRMDTWEKKLQKMEAYYRLLLQWLSLQQEGKNLAEYLRFNGYHNIAIYGMNEAGERLIEELEDTEIEIKYVVDRNADNIVTNLPKFKPDDDLPEVDVMVVTAIIAFQDIQETMEKKVAFPIVSLEDLVYGLA